MSVLYTMNLFQAIVYMEAMVGVLKDYNSFPAVAREIYQTARSAAGEKALLYDNIYFNMAVGTFKHLLTSKEYKEYESPFKNPGEDIFFHLHKI